jgi:MFS transporter, SET family, sugar efflux transporter
MQSSTAPVTALIGTGVFFTGVGFASTLSYGAIAGIETLGIPNASFALLLMVSSLLGSAMSVTFGYVSDRVRDRRVLVLGCALMGVLGYALIYVFRNQVAFVVALAALVPFASITFSQSFSYSRSFYNARRIDRAEFMMSVLRTLFSIAWAVVPPVAGWIAATTSVFEVYGIGALAYVVVALVYGALMLNPTARVGVELKPSATTESAPPTRPAIDRTILVGGLGVILIITATLLNGVTTPLFIVTILKGSLADVGLYAGLAAALEVPFMIMWGYALRRIKKHTIMVFAALLYAIYLLLLMRATSISDVLWLQLINGPAMAALMSIPMSYMQDAIRGRVGLSTSLLDIVYLVSSLTSAALFGAMTAATKDYAVVFAVAAGLAVSGAAVLFAAHRLMGAKALPAKEN